MESESIKLASRSARLLYPVAVLALLSGCGGTASAPSRFGSVSMAQLRPAVNRTSVANGVLYVLNEPAVNDYSVSVYGQKGAKYLRSISSITDTVGFTADSLGKLYLSQKVSPRFFLLNTYIKDGAKVQRTLQQRKPFSSLAVDAAENLYTVCPPDSQLCEYNQYGLTRKLGASGPIAIDLSGNLATLQPDHSSIAVYAPGQDKPYWVASGVNNTLFALAFDASGNLYAALTDGRNAAGNVLIYAPNATSPTLTISEGINNPVGIAIDSKNNLYVLNAQQSSGSVSVYAQGKATPSKTITDGVVGTVPVAGGGSPLAVDSADNLYVANKTGSVTVYPRGSLQPSRTITEGIGDPRAIAI
jgi:hypothetical protein